MRLRGKQTALVALALFAGGCNEFTQLRIGDVANNIDRNEGPPKPAPALAITNSPRDIRPDNDLGVKAAAYVTRHEPTDPNEKAILHHPMRRLHQRAVQHQASLDSYMYRFTRREVVGGARQPEEVIVVKIRREPYSVSLKWLDDAGKGRELIYVQGKYDSKMQVLLAAADTFSLFAGKKMSLAPDDAMVKAKSRYPLTETGLASWIDRYGHMVAGIERGDKRAGTAKPLGQVKRQEFTQKLDCVCQNLPAQSEPNLPKGGERLWFFDPAHGLPVLIITTDATGEVEYYRHEYIQSVRLNDDDFNPEWLWRK